MSTFRFLAPNSTETWDWRNPEHPGIGGSETAVVELARRLSQRGHTVEVICRTRPDTTAHHNVRYRDFETLTRESYLDDGVWIICRSPRMIDAFERNDGQSIWLRCDDLHYGRPPYIDALTPERAAKCDVIQCVSPQHRESFVATYPFLSPEVVQVFAGAIPTDRIAKIKSGPRDPYRMVWTSSPDRGIENAIAILQQARRYEPRLSLHCYYGWDNIDDGIARAGGKHPLAAFKRFVMSMDQTNVVWRGRQGKQNLWRGYAEANFMLYPTADNFAETCGVACQEAQALGCIPITNPKMGINYSVRHGVLIPGRTSEPLTRARYVSAVLTLLEHQREVDEWRADMQADARATFDWERVVDQHERAAS